MTSPPRRKAARFRFQLGKGLPELKIEELRLSRMKWLGENGEASLLVLGVPIIRRFCLGP